MSKTFKKLHETSKNVGLKQVVSLVGSQKELSILSGISEEALSLWRRNIAPVPPKRCVQFEKLTGIYYFFLKNQKVNQISKKIIKNSLHN